MNTHTRNPKIVADFERRAGKFRLGKAGGFIKALWNAYSSTLSAMQSYRNVTDDYNAYKMAYRELCGHTARSCGSLDDFFCPKLTSALSDFLGKDETKRIREECALAMECPYAHTAYRPSYRSKTAGDYADVFYAIIVNAIDFICCDTALEQLLTSNTVNAYIPGNRMPHSNRLALALRSKDANAISFVEEAITGDNSQAAMSHEIISGIVKSGDQHMLEQLGKLLLAAKGQEGLRQAILETCDSGTIGSHVYFIKLVLEHGLCRFSSVIRAFGTWSGLAYGDQKQKVVEKCMALALNYLTDGRAAETGLDLGNAGGESELSDSEADLEADSLSGKADFRGYTADIAKEHGKILPEDGRLGPVPDTPDATEIYLALWALSCRDVNSTIDRARELLGSPEKYKRLVGWYFITHTANGSYRHALAVEYLDIRDPEELAWVSANLHINREAIYVGRYGWHLSGENTNGNKRKHTSRKKYYDERYPADKNGRTALFEELAEAAGFIGKKKTKFSESVFPWYTLELNSSAVCGVMLGLAAYDLDEGLTRRLFEFMPLMDSDYRMAYYALLLDPENKQQRTFLLNGLSDKSQAVREMTVSRLGEHTLTQTDVDRLAQTLTIKNTDLRKSIVTLLKKQDEAFMQPVIEMLLHSKDANQNNAGTELSEIFAKTEKELNIDNGFGLYDPSSDDFDYDVRAKLRPVVATIDNEKLKSMIVPDEKETLALYERIADVFVEYKDYEYETENWDGSRSMVLLMTASGQQLILSGCLRRGRLNNPITDYPLTDRWLAASGDFANEKEKLAALLSIWCLSHSYSKTPNKWFRRLFKDYPVCMDDNNLIRKIKSKTNAISDNQTLQIYRNAGTDTANQILRAILNTDEPDLFSFAFSVYVNLVRLIPEDKLGEEFEEDKADNARHYYTPRPNRRVLYSEYLSHWRHLAYMHIQTDEQFTAYFNEMWWQFLLAGQKAFYGISDEDIFRAHQLGLISDDAVYVYFTVGADAPEHIRSMTQTNANTAKIFHKFPAAKELLAKAIDTIVTVEENRGELPSGLTTTASNIQCFDGGARRFVNLLSALGDMAFLRLHSYARGDLNKQESLSKLLRCCRPVPDDTPEILREALTKAKISEKRVIPAALFAPQWAGLLEEAMDIPGLKCAVWFFHAHINERFSAEKETEVAIFSAISPQQFNDGAFDKDWFLEAHQTLGEKRFKELYKNAKYMTSSSSTHRRSQLYADAVLGRLEKDAAKAEIINKRNQEKLRAYALIPLDDKNPGDALERYEFIQRYKKESRQFGAARQASEGKACQVALDNLAITTGYGNADRMIWALEGAKIELLRPLMKPCAVGDAEIWLDIAEDGTPDLSIRKKGKALKSLPKELAKNETALEIKEAVKQLRDQKRRARQSFESAMIARSEFPAGEITGLLEHPILRTMVSSLVFKAGEHMGFPVLRDGRLELTDADGKSNPVTGSVIIAHPHDFIQHGNWSRYQQHIFRNQIIQPFKQVFREFYPVMQDELDAVNKTRRYAGHQVQPKKTVALLKTRGWTADYEEGLQRVWHKENLIVRMYALADWFSPAEIEAPTLEEIRFFSRDKLEPVPFADIPPVIFSETMRDIDLVVSVAHVGRVDPEASHSTIEMRTAIAGELIALLSVGNVSFQTAHAIIKGSLGEYSVHMGSGITHKAGKGMIAVLPVHSQSRGRIFLPFADDDPKTAEILSKILLFADDKSIKDPGILWQIK